MSFSKLNKLAGLMPKQAIDDDEPDVSQPPKFGEKGYLETNKYLLSKIGELKTEIDLLKYDVITLLNVISQEFQPMTMQDVRKSYSEFRADTNYILQRITDKKELTQNNKLTFNGESE